MGFYKNSNTGFIKNNCITLAASHEAIFRAIGAPKSHQYKSTCMQLQEIQFHAILYQLQWKFSVEINLDLAVRVGPIRLSLPFFSRAYAIRF